MGVALDEAVTVGDLNPDPEVVRVPGGRHLSTGRRIDRCPITGQQIDAGVEVRIAGEGWLYRERGGAELLNDLSARYRTQELTRINRVCLNTCAQVRTRRDVHGNDKQRASRELLAANCIETEQGGDIHPVGGGQARGRVTCLDDHHDASHRWKVERFAHRERHSQARIRPDDEPPREVELSTDAFQGVASHHDVHDWRMAYERRCRNGQGFDDDAVTTKGNVADGKSLLSGSSRDWSDVELWKSASVHGGVAGHGRRDREHHKMSHVAMVAQRLPPRFPSRVPPTPEDRVTLTNPGQERQRARPERGLISEPPAGRDLPLATLSSRRSSDGTAVATR